MQIPHLVTKYRCYAFVDLILMEQEPGFQYVSASCCCFKLQAAQSGRKRNIENRFIGIAVIIFSGIPVFLYLFRNVGK